MKWPCGCELRLARSELSDVSTLKLCVRHKIAKLDKVTVPITVTNKRPTKCRSCGLKTGWHTVECPKADLRCL